MRQVLHALFATVPAGQPVWTIFKLRLGTEFGLSDDTLHMTTGLAIMTAAALVLRRAPWSRWPWLAVLVAETLNEAYDLTHGSDEGNWPDSWHDFWITLLWPTVVLLVWRRWGARPAVRFVVPSAMSGGAVDQPLDQAFE